MKWLKQAPLLLLTGWRALRFFKKRDRLSPQPVTGSPPVKVIVVRPAPPPDEPDPVEPPAAGLLNQLTPRELEVLDLIASGLTNQEIAGRLTLAPSTVKTHINNLYGKLGVRSRARAVRCARAWGLVQ